MNEAMRPSRIFALLLAALLGLAGCRGSGEPPLEGAAIGGPFVLTDQDGRTVRDSDFAGRYRLIYFGYSFCPDVCPTDLQSIGQAMARLDREAPAKARRVQPIFITVDPERDTPEVLKSYVAAFHPRLIGLTGTPDQIEAVKKSYAIFSTRQAPAGAAEDAYLVDHSRQTILFGPDGKPIALVASDEGPDAIVGTLEKWVE
jgi:protein SCO1/2